MDQANKLYFSGPIETPLSEESPAVQAAPAYDVAKAREYLPKLKSMMRVLDMIPEPEGISVFGAKGISNAALLRLWNEIAHVLNDDHQVSLIMVDPRAETGVAFQSMIPMCTQSTIKAIYVGAVLDERPEALSESGKDMREAILYSSNEAYERLRNAYGTEPMKKWCREAGVDESFAEPLYPRDKCARDMLKMWVRLYEFLNSGKVPGNFGAYYADSIVSATRERLGKRFPVQTKAGWENGLDEDQKWHPDAVIPEEYTDGDPLNDECAINDTGIVYTPEGPYLFVIYTDYPFGIFPNYTTLNPLYGLVDALYAVHEDWCK